MKFRKPTKEELKKTAKYVGIVAVSCVVSLVLAKGTYFLWKSRKNHFFTVRKDELKLRKNATYLIGEQKETK